MMGERTVAQEALAALIRLRDATKRSKVGRVSV